MPRLDHIAIRVSDMQAAIAFYTEKLGLELLFHKVDREHRESFAFLQLEGGNLELLQLLDQQGQPLPMEPPVVEKPYCPHLALASDDLDEDVARLHRHSIPLLDGPLEIAGSVRWLYFCDPDNNVLEYVQWLDPQS